MWTINAMEISTMTKNNWMFVNLCLPKFQDALCVEILKYGFWFIGN